MLAVQIAGTLSKDPEQRTTTKGNPFAFSSVRIAAADGDTSATSPRSRVAWWPS